MPTAHVKCLAPFILLFLLLASFGRGEAQSVAGNFGSVAIGQTGSTLSVTLTFTNAGTLASQLVLTGGAVNQDFAIASGGSCGMGLSYGLSGSCTVSVIFTPRCAGLRRGAVVLENAAGDVLGTAYVSGVGTGPQAAFHVISRQLTTFPNLTFAADRGIAVDGSGNLFVASINAGSPGDSVVEVPAGCTAQSCVKQLPGTFSAVRGLAVDGAGNLWVGDAGTSGSITEIVAAGGYSTAKKYAGSFGYQIGVAVDGAGNVYFTGGDSGSAAMVTELLASSGYTTAQVLTTGYNSLGGIAVDGSGNVFFADPSSRGVKEIVAVNGSIPSTPTITSLGYGMRNLSGLALDGGGNVYALGSDAFGFGLIFELPEASGYSIVNELSNQTNPLGIALDAGGNLFGVYYTNQALGGISINSIFELPRSSAPSLVYSTPTAPGQVDSADGPQEVIIESIGNQPLSLAGLKVSDGNFSLDPSKTTCMASTTLAVGDSCLLSIVFNPVTTGNITGSVSVTDNALNAASSKQSIALSGQSLYTPLVTIALTSNVVAVSQALPLRVTVNGGSGNPIPTGTIQINASGYNSAQLTLSGGSASITIPAGTLSPGRSTILATYQPDPAGAFNYTTAAQQVTLRVTSTIMNIPTVSVTPAVMSISLGQALSVTVAVGQVNGAPMPSGTITLAGGNYTSPATALSNGSVTLTIPANSLIIGTDELIATYSPDADSATVYLTSNGVGFVAVSAAATAAGAAPVDFGSLGIGKTSAMLPVTLTFPANSTPATLIATTQGATGKDFAIVSGGSCGVGINVAAGQNCTVNLTFTPGFAGLRNGAVVAQDQDGQTLAMTYVHGSGTGAQISIQSNTYYGFYGVSAANVPFSFTTLSDGFSRPNVAVDGAGNVFVADWGSNSVKKIPAGCTSSTCTVTVTNGISTPSAVAVDGAGNLFVTEVGYGDVKKIPLGCTSPSCMQTVGSGFNQPFGVAVDASGNVFVADTYNNAIKEVVAAGGYSTIKTLASGLNLPWSVVVNAGGDLFVAEGGDQCPQWIPGICSSINTSLLQITAASDYKTVNTLDSGGFGKPFGLAIDGGGNVYEADYGDSCATEYTAGSGYVTAHRLCSTGGWNALFPEGLAVDSGGNLYLGDVIKGSVHKLDYVNLPSMIFKTATLAGVADVRDGPQVVTVQNNGTAPLTFTSMAFSDSSFKLNSTVTTCSTSTPLAAGSSCYLAADFAPTTTGPLPGTLTLIDNNLNQSPATQVIKIAAVALPPVPVILTSPANLTTSSTGVFTFSDAQTPIIFLCSVDSLPFTACTSPATYSTLGGGPHAFQVKASDAAGNLSNAAVYNWMVTSVGPPAPVITSAPAYLTDADTATFTFTDARAGVTYQCSLDGGAFTACSSGVTYSGLSVVPPYPGYIVSAFHGFAVKAMDAANNFSPETTRNWTEYVAISYPVDFGLVAVGQTSSAQSVTFNTWSNITVVPGAIASIDALTMGVTGLDFTVTDPGTCTVGKTVGLGGACTLKATFTPRYPGQRKGAVILLDASGKGIGEAYLQGTGTAPQVTFGPYSTVVYNILAAQNNADPGKDLVAPVADVAVDGAGNVYASDLWITSVDQSVSVSSGDIWKFPVGCTGPNCSALISSARGSSYFPTMPSGLSLDGAGVLWTSNFWGSPDRFLTVGVWYTYECSYVPLPYNFYNNDTAVDGAGNASYVSNGLLQYCAKNLGVGQTTQTTSFDFSTNTPSITVDPQNNFFVADAGNNAVKEVLSSSNYTIARAVGSGFSNPTSVASDAFGNIYVSDTGNNALKEIVAASGYTQVVTLATFDPKVFTLGNLTVDAQGNVYIAGTYSNFLGSNSTNTSHFIKLNFSDAPALSFPTATKIGSTDTTDGTLTATVKNSGNQSLTISGLALSNTNFSLDANATTCSTSAPLAVSGSCTVGVLFTPDATGPLTGTLTLTDNALNASGTTQQFALSGTGFLTPSTSTPTVVVAPASSNITTAQSDTMTITVSGKGGSATPTGTVSLFGGSYTSATGSLSGGSATFIIPAGILALGSTTVNAIYTPDTASSTTYGTGAGSAAISVTAVSKSTPTVTVIPASIDVSSQQSLNVTISVSGGNGNPTPTGSVTLSGGNYASLATTLSSGTATITIPSGYLPAGAVNLTAYYTPDLAGQANYTNASGNGLVAVQAAAKATPTVTVTPATASLFTSQALRVTIAVGSGNFAPTGLVILTSGSYASAAAPLYNGSVILLIPAGTLAAGSNTLVANYAPDNASALTYTSAVGSNTANAISPITSGNFGTISVGQSSKPIALTLTFSGSGTIGNVTAMMQGAPAMDFAVVSGGTCALGLSFTDSNTCTANVTFSPKFTGTRFGAVIVKDSSGNTVAMDLVDGVGSGPQARFIPKYASYPWKTLGGGLFTDGFAVDGVGNVFVVDANLMDNSTDAVVVKEVPAGCMSASCVITLAPTYTLVGGPKKGLSIALDSNGNVFIAASSGPVYEITVASGYQTAIALANGVTFPGPYGLAVDRNGNVFVTAGANGGTKTGVYEIPAAGGYTTFHQVAIGLTGATGIAVDISGNLFVSTQSSGTQNLNGVFEILALGGYTTFKPVGSGIGYPQGIAVDQSGNVWVADQSAYGVYEILADGGYTTVEAINLFDVPNRIALDTSGNLYASGTGGPTIDVFDFTKAAASWAPTPVGSTGYGVQTFALQNIGNAPLNLSDITLPGTNFHIDSGTTTCSNPSALAAGTSCLLGFTFNPSTAGALTGALTLTDDALNVAGATQNIFLSGTGTAVTVATTTQLQASASSVAFGDSVSFSVAVTPASGATVPTGSVKLMDGASTLTTLTLNASGAASFATTTLSAGSHSITAAYGGDTTGSASTSSAVIVTVVAPVLTASVAPSSLNFTAVSGSISATQQITLTNTGNSPLSITGIAIGGTSAGVFAETSTCGAALNAGSYCIVSVTFSPTSAASFSATLSVADSASNSPQTVSLSGTGTPPPGFTLSSATPAGNVQQGSVAGFTITVTPQNGAFNNVVTFSASGLPPGATASFSPATLTPGSTAATTQMSIHTGVATAQGHRTSLWPVAGSVLAMVGILFLPRRRRHQWLTLCILFFSSLGALTLSGCGGGFASRSSAKTYTIAVVGASGNIQQTTTVQLTIE